MDRDFPFPLYEVPDSGACSARRVDPTGAEQRVIVLRRGESVWGYVNRCPHFSVPLDFEPGEFATYDGEVLTCAHHSALFRYEDGYCIEGPCQGQQLDSVALRVKGSKVFLAEDGDHSGRPDPRVS